jgi:predicted nucleic acid-binding protein
VSFLLDTNVISEWVKPLPDRGVIEWLAAVDEDLVYISVITISELRFGIERLPRGARRRRLEDWLASDLPMRFESRIIPVNVAIADSCGRIRNQGRAAGRPIAPMDAFIAATAQIADLTLVTRNASDFEFLGQSIISPWNAT